MTRGIHGKERKTKPTKEEKIIDGRKEINEEMRVTMRGSCSILDCVLCSILDCIRLQNNSTKMKKKKMYQKEINFTMTIMMMLYDQTVSLWCFSNEPPNFHCLPK